MKRLLVFLLLGPILGVVAALSPDVLHGGFNHLHLLIGAVVFLFGLVVSAVGGIVDDVLSRAISISLRAPLTALTGATMAVFVPAALFFGQMPPPWILKPFAITGALCAGVCSLLAHDYNAQKTQPGDISGSLS